MAVIRDYRRLELLTDCDGEEGDVTVSMVVRRLIERATLNRDNTGPRRTQMHRKHLSLTDFHIRALDQLATEWGIVRSQALQRLIDQAAADGFVLEFGDEAAPEQAAA